MAHIVQGLSNLIVQVQCKFHQQLIRWSGNLGRIVKSEKVSFQMVTERHYAILWLNMFREWFPKSKYSNWKSTSPSMSFNPGEQTTSENRTNRALWAWVLKKAWKIDMKVLQKKERARLRGLAVARWTTGHYHPCSNPGVGIFEGCFIFQFVSLPLEVAHLALIVW